MVLEGVFVPHQLSVTFAVEELLLRLLPPGAVLPAKRLKFMVREPAPVLLPSAMPPPRSVVLLPVMVTFCRLTVSVHAAGQPLLLVLVQMPPPSCAFGRFAVPAMLFVIELEVIERLTSLWIPPPFPAAWLPEMTLPVMTLCRVEATLPVSVMPPPSPPTLPGTT